MIPRVSNRTPSRTPSRASLCLLLAVALLAAPARSLAQSCLAGTAADEFTADGAGLTREWILQLPSMANGSSLAQVVIGDGLVVAQTSEGACMRCSHPPLVMPHRRPARRVLDRCYGRSRSAAAADQS